MAQLILSEKQITKIVATSVEQTLKRIGFDPDNFIETQADLAFIRNLRKSNQQMLGKIKTSILWAAITISASLIWYIVRVLFEKL